MADPTTIPNLSAWWEADSLALANGAEVATLPDLGPNDFDATQGTAAQRPTFATAQINGLPALAFNGSSQWLTSAAPTAATEQTVVALLRPVATASGVDTIRGGSMQVALNSRRPQTFRGGVGSIGAANTVLDGTAFAIITFSYNATTGAWAWWLNGGADGSGTQIRSFAATGTAIGRANPTQAQEFFSGHLAALVTFDRVLTANERAQEHTRLSDKYDITVADYVDDGPPPEPVPAAGERINLIARPSFEIADVTGWVARRGGVPTALSRSLENGGAAAPAPVGAFYGFHTPAAGGDVEVEHTVVPVTAGQTYTGSIHVHRAQTGDVRAFLDWFTDTGASAGTSAAGTTETVGSAWVRLHATGTAPTGAVSARVRVLATDQAGNGVRVDAALIERGAELLPYFDGSTAGATWDGTPHASYSRYVELLWVGDVETGDLSQFRDNNPGDHEPDNESEVVTSPVRLGGFALRSTVVETTTASNVNGQQRAERETQFRDAVPGDELWLAESVQLLPGFPTSPGTFQLVTQWKNRVGGSPPLALHVENGRMQLQGGFGYPGGSRSMPTQDLGPAVVGQWDDWLWHIRFQEGPDAGTVSIWRNGVQLLTDYVPPGGTLYPGSTSYLKIGLYRGITAPVPAAVVHDEMRIGLTRQAVELGAPPPNVRTGTGTTSPLALTTTSAGTAERAAAGSAELTLTATGTGAGERLGGSTVLVVVAAVGIGRKATNSADTAPGVAFDATGIGRKVATGNGATVFTLDSAGVGVRTASGAGSRALTLITAGSGTGTRTGSAPPLQLATEGTGRKVATGRGTAAPVTVDAVGAGRREGVGRSAAPSVQLTEAATGARAGLGTGAALVALAAAGDGATTRPGFGRGGVELDVAGTGTPTAVGQGSSHLLVDSTGTGRRDAVGSDTTDPVRLIVRGAGERTVTGSGAKGLRLTARSATGPRLSFGHGQVRLGVTADGTGTRTPTGIGGSSLAVSSTSAGSKTGGGTGRADITLAASGAQGDRNGTGAAPAVGLTADGTGRRTAIGRGSTRLALVAAATGQRRASGTGTSSVQLAANGQGQRSISGGGRAPRFTMAAPGAAGQRITVGAGISRLRLVATADAGPVGRPGGGRPRTLRLTAITAGSSSISTGQGSGVPLRTSAAGRGPRTARGRGGSTGLALFGRARRRIAGVLTATATTSRLEASA